MQQKVEINENTKHELLSNLGKLQGKKVLILGDIGLDEYLMGEVRRISPEAPVPILEVTHEEKRLGMAANVAQNVLSLGGEPLLLGVIGEDRAGENLKSLMLESGLKDEHLIVEAGRPTTLKSRMMSKHHHLLRVDHELKRYLSEATEQKLINRVQELTQMADILIIEDYAKGVLSERCLKSVINSARDMGKKTLLDPNRATPASYYQGVDLLKPNFDEALVLSGLSFDDLRDDPDKVIKVGQALKDRIQVKEVIITEGQKGMTIFAQEKITRVPTYARQVFDVTGAGDTVIAALALGQSAGFTIEKSCILANFAAGVVVGKIGCVPCSIAELKEYIQGHI